MQDQDPVENAQLLRRTGLALGMNAHELGKLLGVSRRSVSRWTHQGTWLFGDRATTLIELVYPRDRALAARLAEVSGQTLSGLGLEAPPPIVPAVHRLASSPTAAPKLLDAVVCAAAEAMDASPRAVRPALLAAVKCARDVGLTLEAMEGMLEAQRAASASATRAGTTSDAKRSRG